MNINPGDRLKVLKEVYDKSRVLKVGTLLDVIWINKKSLDHIRRCVDQKGRTRYIHMADALDGCFEKVSEAAPMPVAVSPRTFREPRYAKSALQAEIRELKDFQNILVQEKNREISMILEIKRTLEEERDQALHKLAERGDASGHGREFIDRLKASMRNWVLAIQFSAPHSAMRKEIQGYLKELGNPTKEQHASSRSSSKSHPASTSNQQ